jgi:hypothetical protein
MPELLPPAEAANPQEPPVREVAGSREGDRATRHVPFRPSGP